MKPGWQLIRTLAEHSARAYAGVNVEDPRTSAEALVTSTADGVIVVAFRGSEDAQDFLQDAGMWFADLLAGDGVAAVHHGFPEDFESINEAVMAKVNYFLTLNID